MQAGLEVGHRHLRRMPSDPPTSYRQTTDKPTHAIDINSHAQGRIGTMVGCHAEMRWGFIGLVRIDAAVDLLFSCLGDLLGEIGLAGRDCSRAQHIREIASDINLVHILPQPGMNRMRLLVRRAGLLMALPTTAVMLI